jgi:hypothetical protein
LDKKKKKSLILGKESGSGLDMGQMKKGRILALEFIWKNIKRGLGDEH